MSNRIEQTLHTPVARDRLRLAFSTLRSYGIEARVTEGEDPESELDRLLKEIHREFPSATGCRLIMLESELSGFDQAGEMTRPVMIHFAGTGVLRAARAALDRADLGVIETGDGSRALVFDRLAPSGATGKGSVLAGLEQ